MPAWSRVRQAERMTTMSICRQRPGRLGLEADARHQLTSSEQYPPVLPFVDVVTIPTLITSPEPSPRPGPELAPAKEGANSVTP